MKKSVAIVVASLACSGAARADSPVLFAPARVQDGPQVAAFLGTHQVGLSFTFAQYGAELAFQHFDRRLELRGGWRVQLIGGPVFAAWRVSAAGLVGFGPFDLGAGMHTGLSVGIGGDPIEGYAGVEAALETRVRQAFAVPLRALVGARVRAGLFDLSVQGRVTALPPVLSPSRIEGVILLSRLL